MFETIDEKLLLDIFRIPAPSNKEEEIAEFVKKKLTDMKVNYSVDKSGCIYNVSHPGRPMLSCHMDTVQKENDVPLAKLIDIYELADENKTKILKGAGIIGGDDKCGIYIILSMLKIVPDLNFVFSVGEEVGCVGAHDIVKNVSFKDKKILYGLILDRRNNCDIICVQNTYGTYLFQDELVKIGKDFGYSPVTGSSSDAGVFKEYFSCSNLSVGYHRPHSVKEYVKLPDLLKALNYVEKIVTTLTKEFAPPAKTVPVKSASSWDGYEYGSYYSDSYWDHDINGRYKVNGGYSRGGIKRPDHAYSKDSKKKKPGKVLTKTGAYKHYPLKYTCCWCKVEKTDCYYVDTLGKKDFRYICKDCLEMFSKLNEDIEDQEAPDGTEIMGEV